MSEKKTNEILEEQRRAREEFLKLKQMQQGEIEPPKKPSELSTPPKTPKEKMQNFWFHYKWHTIGSVFLVVVLTILTVQMVTRTKYDMEIVMFSYSPMVDVYSESIGDYFEEYATDLNGDGEVNIQVINCSFDNNGNNVQYRNTVLTKLQSIIAADQSALLYITDEESYEFFDKFSEDVEFFLNEPIVLDEEFYEKTKSDDFGKLPEGLQISCRNLSGTILEDKEDVSAVYEEALRVLAALKK